MFNRFFVTRTIIFILFLCIFSSNVFAESKSSDISLRYGEHKDFDRFVLEYSEKPEYKIVSDNYITYIRLPNDINIINDKSLDKYPRKFLFSKSIDEDGVLIAIPSPIVKNFEYEDSKIVIDVVSYKDIKKEQSEIENEIAKTENQTESFQNQAKDSNILRFPWDKEVGLSAFERNGNLWLIFDSSSEPDLSNIDTQQSDFISNILQIPSTNITALIITTKGDFVVNISKEDLNWNVALTKNGEDKTAETLEVLIKENKNGAYLYVPTKNVRNVITMLDPYTGDLLMVAPVVEPNLGFKTPYKYVDLKLLQTYQGLALEALTDDLIIKKEADRLVIEGFNRGLNISPNLEKLKKEEN